MRAKAHFVIEPSDIAKRDIRRIRAYVRKKFGAKVANRAVRGIFDRIDLLKEHPFSGKLADTQLDGASEVRMVIKGPSIVYYTVQGQTILILRIYDARQSPL